MNLGKVGAPFEYSYSYIRFLAFLKIGYIISYKTVQEIVHGLSDYIKVEEIHFTQLRRILKIKTSTTIKEEIYFKYDDDIPLTLIIDASGLTVSKRKETTLKIYGYVRKKSLLNYTLHLMLNQRK